MGCCTDHLVSLKPKKYRKITWLTGQVEIGARGSQDVTVRLSRTMREGRSLVFWTQNNPTGTGGQIGGSEPRVPEVPAMGARESCWLPPSKRRNVCVGEVVLGLTNSLFLSRT